ncbi:MAG: cytochrome c oxidase subunit II [Planctomycetales bacterium]|nr:cytochrome c oxidase subunit II [Planctomycetales bacterium]
METARPPASASALAAFFVVLAALTALGFAAISWLPVVASEHGPGVDRTIVYILVVTGVLFLVGHAVLAGFVWRYSRGGTPEYRPLSPKVEWSWALLPVLALTVASEVGVLVIGGPAWSQIYGETPAGALEIEVVGKQFEWLVRYPGKDGRFGRTAAELVHDVRNPVGLDKKDPAASDDVVLRGALHLPEGRPVVVRLRSLDVLHSFAIPELRVKQDIVPGHLGRTQFRPVRAGSYELACAELCGLGHYRMSGKVVVEPAPEFERWLREQAGWFE